MTIGRYVLFAVLIGGILGCGTSKEVKRILDSPIVVDTEIEEGADFSKYATWTWLRLPGNTELDPRIDNPEFKGNVNNAVERELFTRGYKKNEQSPDLLINGHAVFQEIDQDYIDAHYDGTYYPEYQTDIAEGDKQKKRWQEGTIILFFFDAKTRQLVYQASAQAEITDSKYTTPEQRQARVDQAVAQMMEDFPRR